jgi:chaperonin GroEL
MVYRPKVDDKLCFVLMPFGHPFDSYYQKIIKPAASDAGLATLRSDEIYSTKAIINDIWARIWAARVIVADVTGRNPNVNYELGLCDALGIPTIIITGNIEDVPFDYKHRRCILYKREDAGWDDKLRADLANTIRTVLVESLSEAELEWPYDTGILKEPVSAGVLIASADGRKIVIRGARLVRDAIASAFGPRGASVAISQAFGPTKQSQRGAQIAQGIKSSNPLEEKGIEQIRAAASAVYDSAGDCSKLVSILAAGFMTIGQELIERGFHPKDILTSLERSVEKTLKHLGEKVRPVTGDDILAVATTAAGGDRRTGELVVQAMKRAGKHGIIAIETSDQSETKLEVREGVQFDRGYLSEYFITKAETLECILENCCILFHQGRIQAMRDLLPLLEQVARTDKSLLIISDDVEGEALATLTLNKIRGTLRCAAVRAPGQSDRRKALMEDFAVLTGGKFLSLELGVPLTNVRLEDLGKAERVVIRQDDTTIIGGAGSSEAIQERVRSIQIQILNTASSFDREKLQERLAQMAGCIAVLKVGGVSEADLFLEKYKLESALRSTRAAAEHGIVVGGGIALLRIAQALRTESTDKELDAETRRAVASVLEEPVRQLVENARKSPTQILADVLKSESPFFGFNAERCKIEDLLSAGVLDAARPITLSLRVALSHAGSVLQTGTWDLSPPPAPQRPGQFPNA